MSRQFDVLAAISIAADTADLRADKQSAHELRKAYAAVADLVKASRYALAQHQAPHLFRPDHNHWSAVLGNAIADFGGAE